MSDANNNAALARRLKIESLTGNDIAAVTDLERQSFSSPWTEELYAAALERPFFRLWGAKLDGALAGYVSVYHLGVELEIINIAVNQALRRQGAGSLLLRHVRCEAEVSGAERIILEVRRTNAPAIALYESQGFVQAGIRQNYYPDTGEDALVYVLQLTGII